MRQVTIFVEGIADKKFLHDLILAWYGVDINLKEKKEGSIIDCGGKGNLQNLTTTFERNYALGFANLVIFDADTPLNAGGFAPRTAEILRIKQNLKLNFDLFLFPNNQEDGDLETLLERIAVQNDILECWAGYESCLKTANASYYLPAKKSKIYSYLEVLTGNSDQSKDSNRNFLNVSHWNLSNYQEKDSPLAALRQLLDNYFLS
jgi:hypothetical protein